MHPPGAKSLLPFGTCRVPVVLLFSFLLILHSAVGGAGNPLVAGYRTIRVFPHDPEAFTQGLVFHQGLLYEGTGLYGRSSLRKVDLESGRILMTHRLPDDLFGEGITIWRDRVIQLTWRSGLGLVYEKAAFRLLKKFSYPTEGWGLTHNGTHLIMSDGTEALHFLDPVSFKPTRRLIVRDRGVPVIGLNELEYIRGEILANVFPSDRIVRISPSSGKVSGWIDLTGLGPPGPRGEKVLNGIAYDQEKNRIFVTGKCWPHLFEVQWIGR